MKQQYQLGDKLRLIHTDTGYSHGLELGTEVVVNTLELVAAPNEQSDGISYGVKAVDRDDGLYGMKRWICWDEAEIIA